MPTRRLTSCNTVRNDTGPELAPESKHGIIPPFEDVTFYEILDQALFGLELPVNALTGHYPVAITLRSEKLIDGRPGGASYCMAVTTDPPRRSARNKLRHRLRPKNPNLSPRRTRRPTSMPTLP